MLRRRVTFLIVVMMVSIACAPAARSAELRVSSSTTEVREDSGLLRDAPPLSQHARDRLFEAAAEPSLEPWQRDMMLDLSGAAPSRPTEDQIASPHERAPSWMPDDGTWSQFPPHGRRALGSAVYDPIYDRMVVFGGSDLSRPKNDVWSLNLTGPFTWQRLSPSGTPPARRSGHSAIYDPDGQRMVVFGGYDSTSYRNDVWALSLTATPAWVELAPSGGRPSERQGHTAIYDSARKRVVVFGGYPYANDTWALSLSGDLAWTAIQTAGAPPSARGSHTAVYDPPRDRMIVFGGASSSQNFLGDVWELSFAVEPPQWGALSPTGTSPEPRRSHVAIVDSKRDRMIVFGGWTSNGLVDDTWALDLGDTPAWEQLVPSGEAPRSRIGHAAIFDPIRQTLVIFGGIAGVTSYPTVWLGDTWALSLTAAPTWNALGDQLIPPPNSAEAVYDPIGKRTIMVCSAGTKDALMDVWALSLAGEPEWSRMTPFGAPPPARTWESAIYDSRRRRIVLFGGYGYGGVFYNDVWELKLGPQLEWNQLFPTGQPPVARRAHSATYDVHSDRMIIFGGAGEDDLDRRDTFVLTFSDDANAEWSQIVMPLRPPPRSDHVAIFDPLRDRMIIFGGTNNAEYYRNDVWQLSLNAAPLWTQIVPGGANPAGRAAAVAIYDPVRDRMVVQGGNDYLDDRNDCWSLSLGESPQWQELLPDGELPLSRSEHAAVYDPREDRLVIFGGWGGLNDLWFLNWSDATGIVGNLSVPSLAVSLEPPMPNPTSDRATIRFRLAAPSPATLAVYDVSGRLVRELLAGNFQAGLHEVVWDGRDDQRGRVADGVYFLRLDTEIGTTTRKAVRLSTVR